MGVIDNVVTKTIDKQMGIIGTHLTEKIDEMTSTLVNTALGTVSNMLSVAAAGALMYIFYHSLKMMFFQDDKDMQKVLFGYIVMLLLRIGGIAVEGQMIK